MTGIEERYRHVKEEVATQERLFTAEELVERFETSVAERREELPKPDVTIFFGAHADAQDLESMRPQFERCQVYIPEFAGHGDALQERYQSISDGTLDPGVVLREFDKDYKFLSFLKAEIAMLHRSGKGVCIIDLPSDHPLVPQMRESYAEYNTSVPPELAFSEATALVRQRIERFATLQVERERYMVAQFPERYAAVVRSRPALMRGEEVHVLVRIGVSHTMMLPRFTEAGIQASDAYEFEGWELGPIWSLTQMVMRGEQATSELLAKTLLMYLVRHRIPPVWSVIAHSPAFEFGSFTDKLAAAFSEEEIEELWERNRAGLLTESALRDIIAARGLTLPE